MEKKFGHNFKTFNFEMDLNHQVEKLKVLLSKGKLKEAIEQLDCFDDADFFSKRFYTIEREKIKEEITRETYKVETNKLSSDLLIFLKNKIKPIGDSNLKQTAVIRPDYMSRITDDFILNLEIYLIMSASFDFSNKKDFGLKVLSYHFIEQQLGSYSQICALIKELDHRKRGYTHKITEIIQKLVPDATTLQGALNESENETHSINNDATLIIELCTQLRVSLLKMENPDLLLSRLEVALSRLVKDLNEKLAIANKFSKN